MIPLRRILIVNPTDMSIRKRFDLSSVLLLSILINVVIVSVISFKSAPKPLIVNKYKFVVIQTMKPIKKLIPDLKLIESEIIHELRIQNCILPNVAYAQFIQETLHFKSKICLENKNFAGIRNSKSKYVIGMNRGHCVYNSYKDCIKDYVRIQNHYLNAINKKYAEDPKYIANLHNLKTK